MSDFKLVNITDSALEDITSELTLPVVSGSSSNNFQTFKLLIVIFYSIDRNS